MTPPRLLSAPKTMPLDKFLTIIEKSDIAGLLNTLPYCQHIITTGKKATELLLEDFDAITPNVGQSVDIMMNGKTITLHRLPSSSRAYPLSLDKKAAIYQAIFKGIGLAQEI